MDQKEIRKDIALQIKADLQKLNEKDKELNINLSIVNERILILEEAKSQANIKQCKIFDEMIAKELEKQKVIDEEIKQLFDKRACFLILQQNTQNYI